MALVKLCMLFE